MVRSNKHVAVVVLWCCLSSLSVAQEPADYVPDPGQFAPIEKGHYLAGELVYIDPVNRRGGIRLHGDEKGRY